MSDESAWVPITDYERYWAPFDAAFSFAPRSASRPDDVPHPGIAEPPGSVTFSLAPITQTGSEPQFCAGVDALNAEVLRAFVTAFAEGERLVVLDWQHTGYRFRPHAHAIGSEEWKVSPFPNGDYYIFVSEDLTSGTFGHPWEQSLCVFGDLLVDVLAPTLSGWLPILRRNS